MNGKVTVLQKNGSIIPYMDGEEVLFWWRVKRLQKMIRIEKWNYPRILIRGGIHMVDKRDAIPLGKCKDHITADVDREWWTFIIATLMFGSWKLILVIIVILVLIF